MPALEVLEPPVNPSSGSGSHQPVMVSRITQLLAVTSGPAIIVDTTVGAAGHAAALLAASSQDVHLLGFDRDPDALVLARRRLTPYGDRVHLVHAGYDELAHYAEPVIADVGPVASVLYDLGVSSLQLDRGERGFSFRADAPLDMRMDPTTGQTAAELVATADVADLTRILRLYGEERFAGRIAAAMVRSRPQTTVELAAVVAGAVPARTRHAATHPATRTFQALRIAVNAELDRFGASLPQALELVEHPVPARAARIAVLSYHSLEDRITKRTFAAAATGCVCPPDLPMCLCGREPRVRLLTRGAERPAAAETAANPRARSAKLRAVETLGER
ncbi:MAG: 16S rRNA (cytosine(1402)-N(4))-methyltransferase RsmH [Nitriliruptorales bacterium]|nr:16S rRNA (cytosine(1402)-N(4))-methyltransferase RsmH [Nitriliruptorales bacterium]